MVRPIRIEYEGTFRHVASRGNERDPGVIRVPRRLHEKMAKNMILKREMGKIDDRISNVKG